jgi:hypothetical protein
LIRHHLRTIPAVFALDVDGTPTLAFEARNTREARHLCHEGWLRADLTVQTSNGSQLCGPDSKLSVRRATDEEAQIFYLLARGKPTEDLPLAYLVELDDPK